MNASWALPAASAPSPALVEWPGGFEAEFEVRAGGLKVALTQWRLSAQPGSRFVYESHTRSAGLASLFRKDSIIERSEGVLVGETLRPLKYRYDRHRRNKRRLVEIDFDWSHYTAANSLAGRQWKMAIPKGTLDKLSYLLVMMRDLRRGERELRYEIADGGKLKTYHLEMIATEEVETSLGIFTALGMRRVRDAGTNQGQRETVLWCAEQLGYFPVKIFHREPDGNSLEVVLTQAKGL